MAVSARRNLAGRVPPRGGGRLGVGLAYVMVLAVLGLVGAKLAADAGRLGERAGQGSGSAPGIVTSGQLVQPRLRLAPAFTLSLFSGESLRLADRRGQPVLVNFWASWCPPCREEAPRLERLWREYRERGVAVVGIDVWDTERDARRFLREAGVTYPNGPDPGGRIAMDFGVAGVPETVLIDGDGQIARKWIGPFTEAAAQVFRRDVVALGDG